MTLQQLHYIIVISETGSLSKAAEVLYVSQPSLSDAVQDMEKELGFPLFYRSSRGMSLTNDGMEFISYARQVYNQYEMLLEKYGKSGKLKKKFGISTQHYSFAVKSFVEMVKQFNTAEYEFAIRETKTREVIDDVHSFKSEIGIIYLSDFNRQVITKLLKVNDLEFHKLIDCDAYVYIWKGHPLAKCKTIRFEQLADYPCLSFEQGSDGSFYFAEEILSTNEYHRVIKANDRATMLNLMIGLNGYTLCSGIICEELNGTDYIAVPFEPDSDNPGSKMEIGYIVKKNLVMSKMGELYIQEIKRYLEQHAKPVKLTWRKELALTIDRLIYMSTDLDSLHANLKEKGYEVRKGKYISIKPQGADRAVRTKTLSDEYTEENLIKRLNEKQLYLQKAEEKMNSTTGIEREFYVGVYRTVTLIFEGRKIPKKYNAAKSYSINNDWHINELASEISVINSEKVSSVAELNSRIEKAATDINELQASVNELGDMQWRIREVLANAEFYFENKDRRGDAMFTAKLGRAKELLRKFGISNLAGLEPLRASYSENVKALAGLNGKIGELHSRQSSLLKLQETYQSIVSGKYLEKITEKQRKEQGLI